MRVLKSAGAIIAFALACALVACGSEDAAETTGAGATTATAAAPAAPQGDSIVVGFVCSCTGPQAASIGKSDDTVRVWERAVNAAGGINGHPVKVIVKDDGGTPAKGLAAVKELVESDKVVAIVGQTSYTDASWAAYVEAKGVPVVGGNALETPYLTSASFFSTGTPLPVAIVAQALLAQERGKQHLGILYCAESPVCAQLEKIGAAASGMANMRFTSGKIAGTSPDFMAPCLALRDAGVDTLFVASNSSVSLRVISDCAKQGFRPLVLSEATTVGPGWLKDDNVQGTLVINPDAPYTDASLPAVKAFLDAADEYAPSISDDPEFSYLAFFPWVGGKLFEAAAKQVNLSPTSSPQDVTEGLYALKNETLDGLTPPLTYTKGQPSFIPCYFVTEVADGAFQSKNDGKPACLKPAQAKQLAQALQG